MTIKELSRYKTLKTEAERLHQRLKSDIVTDTVTGSSHEYPYTKHIVKLNGIEKKCQDQLQRAYTRAYTELLKLEKYIQSIDDPLVRDIIRLRFEECLKWEQVSAKIGGGNSAEGLIMRLKRYLIRC